MSEAKRTSCIANELLKKLEQTWLVPESWIRPLRNRVVSLSYRLNESERLCEPDEILYEELVTHAKKWDANQYVRKGKPMPEKDFGQLKELACYPKFAKLVLKDARLRKECFSWALLNHLSVDVFVEFPAISERLRKCLVKSRLGGTNGLSFDGPGDEYVGGEGLIFDREKKDIRTVFSKGLVNETDCSYTLSILDESQVVELSYDRKMTIKALFDEVGNKNLDEGTIIYLPGRGWLNWDAVNWAYINDKGERIYVDLSDKDKWYKNVPLKKQNLTLEQVQHRFGHRFTGTQWGFVVTSSAEGPKYNFFGAHAFQSHLIRREDGLYDYTYGFGFFTKYPQNRFDTVDRLGNTLPACVQIPDNNDISYPHRRRVEIPYLQTEEQGKAALEYVRQCKFNEREEKLGFQILVANCTKWVAKNVKHYVSEKEGHLFDHPFLEVQPGGILGIGLKFARISSIFRNAMMYFIAITTRGWRGMEVKNWKGEVKFLSLWKSRHWRIHEGIFYHPAKPQNPNI